MLLVRSITSPVSLGEWRLHGAIRHVQHLHEDPEALDVFAIPPDVATYLKLRRLLDGLQTELDTAWAVLGEVYARYPPLNKLGLVIRRVRSNIDDRATFAPMVPYHPVAARMEVAEVDILKLLIQPFYGYRPEFGIRELIQNAVDACNERASVPHQAWQADGLPSQVTVTLEHDGDGNNYVTVSDTGVGMTVETVIDLSTEAGALFRRSEEWRQLHTDAKGSATVLRAGRFGIGVLAAFLLGDELDIITRHASRAESEGIAFTVSVNSDTVELLRRPSEVGTSIRVRVTNDAIWTRLVEKHEVWGLYVFSARPAAAENRRPHAGADPVASRSAPRRRSAWLAPLHDSRISRSGLDLHHSAGIDLQRHQGRRAGQSVSTGGCRERVIPQRSARDA